MLQALAIGFAFGFVGSMPVAGPISLLVLHLGLAHDPRHAAHLAVGGALAEAGYVLLAFWGLATAMERYPLAMPACRMVGAGILLALGVAMLVRRVREEPAVPDSGPVRGTKRSFALGFLVTAVNPSLLVTWGAAVTALEAAGLLDVHRHDAPPFALGACLGIIAWFLVFLRLIAHWRSRVSARAIGRFMKAMGGALVLLGGAGLARGLFRFR